MIDIAINNQILLGIAAFVVLVLIGNVLYIFLKDRQKDKEEIEDLMNSIPERNVEEQVTEFAPKKSEIEEMLEKMQQDLEAKSEDVVENFEKEQEEKSIISYQELLKTLNKETINTEVKPTETVSVVEEKVSIPTETNVVEEMKEEMVQPITTEPTPVVTETSAIQKLMEEPMEETMIEEKVPDTTIDAVSALKKFKNTEFISPVYGKMEGKLEYPTVPSFQEKSVDTVEDVIEEFDRKLEHHSIDDYLENYDFHNHMKIDNLEQTLDMPPISPEVKANEEFLQALKDFRKNLE